MQANDFGSEVIPGAKDMGMHVQAYLYDGYWEDIGTIEAFYNANLALTKTPKPDFRCDMTVNVPCSVLFTLEQSIHAIATWVVASIRYVHHAGVIAVHGVHNLQL